MLVAIRGLNGMDMNKRRDAPIRAKADWDEVLFICRKCVKRQKKQGQVQPLRKWLKRQLKAEAGDRRIRVADCSCLDLCPREGITLVLGSELGDAKKLRVLRNGDDPQRVLDWLLAGVSPRA